MSAGSPLLRLPEDEALVEVPSGFAPALFLVGLRRSGVDVVADALDAHPELAVAAETQFLPQLLEASAAKAGADELAGIAISSRRRRELGLDRDELIAAFRNAAEPGEAARAFYRAYAAARGKDRWADCTPRYLRSIRAIAEALPEARFVHVVRDGRDIAAASLERGSDLGAPGLAKRWRETIKRPRRKARGRGVLCELRYEDAADDPQRAIRELCELCELDFAPAAADALETGIAARPPGRWRKTLDAAQRREFEQVAGELLERLGYERGAKVPAPGPIQRARRVPLQAKRAVRRAGRPVRRWRRSRRKLPPAPFVVGATRSGSTLLRLMLDAHPELAIPPETHFVPELIKARRWESARPDRLLTMITGHARWGDFGLDGAELERRFRSIRPFELAQALRVFYLLYAEGHGKRRWGDKTPGYVQEMTRIQGVLPEARFVHLIRDGRDVALSVLGMSWGPDSLERAARKWRHRVIAGREQAPRLDGYLEVRYEDLVTDTEPTLRMVCAFAGLDFDPVMLRYHERAAERLAEKARDLDRGDGKGTRSAQARMASHALTQRPPDRERLARWREEMPPEDVARFEAIAGDVLADLGYERAGAG